MPKKNRLGEKNVNFQGYEMEVIDYKSSSNMVVKFNDSFNTIRENVEYQKFKSGSLKNKYHKGIFNVGYFGEGPYTARVDKKMSTCYRAWFNLLARVHDETHNRAGRYDDVTICEEWYNYQNFAKWFYNNFDPSIMDGWHIDKDLLSGESKKYSPETCCFIPNEVNTIFKYAKRSKDGTPRGAYHHCGKFQASIQKFGKQHYLGFFNTLEEAEEVYRQAKKEYLKEVANKWRGILPERVCYAIENFDISKLD